MAITVPKFMYPRFYIKSAGGNFSLHHRLTHGYMATYTTEAEVIAELKRLNNLTEYEFWEELLGKQIKIPKQHGNDSINGRDNDEEWFLSAWSFYTDTFYSKNKKLLVEVDEIPYEIISDIRKKMYAAEVAKSKAEEQAKREAEKIYQAELKAAERKRIIPKVTEVPEGKLGNAVGLDKLAYKKKKLIKKKKTDSGSKKVMFNDSDDLFA